MKKYVVGILFAVSLGYLIGLCDRFSVQAETPLDAETYYQGKPMSYWLAQVMDRDASYRQRGISAVAESGWKGAGAVRALLAATRDENIHVRTLAVHALDKLRPETPELTRTLIDCLTDAGCSVRIHAALSLGRVATDTESVVAALIKALGDEEPTVRLVVISALGQQGYRARAAIPALYALLKNSPENIREMTMEALKRIGTETAVMLARTSVVSAVPAPWRKPPLRTGPPTADTIAVPMPPARLRVHHV
jgi:hypothetical protein